MLTNEEIYQGLRIAKFYLLTDSKLDYYYRKALTAYGQHMLQDAHHYLNIFFEQLERIKLGWGDHDE